VTPAGVRYSFVVARIRDTRGCRDPAIFSLGHVALSPVGHDIGILKEKSRQRGKNEHYYRPESYAISFASNYPRSLPLNERCRPLHPHRRQNTTRLVHGYGHNVNNVATHLPHPRARAPVVCSDTKLPASR
jgi:hypothetical protein